MSKEYYKLGRSLISSREGVLIFMMVAVFGTAFFLHRHNVTVDYNRGLAAGTTYYVSTSGNDNNSCSAAMNINNPMKTINNALNCLAAGDTLFIRGGSYNEFIQYVPSGTSWSNMVRIAAYPGETVWLKPLNGGPQTGNYAVIHLDCNCHYIEFDGINNDSTVVSNTSAVAGTMNIWFSTNNGNNPHHIRYKNAEVVATSGVDSPVMLGAHSKLNATGGFELQNLNIHGSASYGIYLMSPNNLIEGNYIHDVGTTAISEWNANPSVAENDQPDNNIIRNNVITNLKLGPYYDHLSLQPGITGFLLAGNYGQIYNNVFYQLGNPTDLGSSGGITLYLSLAANNKIFNNTIVNNNGWGILLSNWNGTQPLNNEIRNNILYGNTSGTVADNGIGTIQSNNLSADPKFVSSSDFHLQSNSPAINAGINLGPAAVDITGASRVGTYDIGAYEFGGTAPPPPPPGPAPPPPGYIPHSQMSIVSSTTDSSNASLVLDNNADSRWYVSGFPNEVVVNLGGIYSVTGINYSSNDWSSVGNYEIYVSTDTLNWGTAVKTGTLTGNDTVTFPAKIGKYLKFGALSSSSGYAFVAELNVAGTSSATPIAGDLNLDHIVNSIDWSIMNSKWFTSDAAADINHDGIVNSIDYSILNANWFKTW